MEQIKKQKNDYEQLYYDELYKNRELNQKLKDLEEEIELLKKHSNNNTKDLIIKELINFRKLRRTNEKNKKYI